MSKRTALAEINCNQVKPTKRIKLSPEKSSPTPAQVSVPAVGINALPNELLGKIFMYLDRKSQLELAATNQRMNDCFSMDSVLKNFQITVDFDTNKLPRFQRAYSHVVFRNLATPSLERAESLNRVMQSMGPHIRKLKIVDSSLTEQYLSKVLCCCSKIESLEFKQVDINCSLPSQPVSFLNLKKLCIDSGTKAEHLKQILSTVSTLEMISFSADSQTSLDDSDDSFDETEDLSILAEILMRQQSLKTLRIFSGIVFDYMIDLWPFQLDSLSLVISSMTYKGLRNMNRCVESQTQLKDVTLNVRVGFKSQLLFNTFDHILDSPTLKTFQIVFYKENALSTYYCDSIKINSNVTELYVNIHSMEHSYRRFIETTSKLFPNLKRLCLSVTSDWTACGVTSASTFTPLNDLKMLQWLTIENFDTYLMELLSFQQLQKIVLPSLQRFDKDEFFGFLIGNRNLTTCFVTFGPQVLNRYHAMTLIKLMVENVPEVLGFRWNPALFPFNR